jgi:parvulin-like peptidyl-prolyl isomerase
MVHDTHSDDLRARTTTDARRKEYRMRSIAIIAVACALLLGCQSKKDGEAETAQKADAQRVEPDYVRVQHILIGFSGSVPGKTIERSQEEARKLAEDVLARAKKGEDFDALVREYTADSPPGLYWMANNGMSQKPGVQMFMRSRMVKGFGDVGFSLDVGEIGMAEYDANDSPFGWHIIKRVE